MLVLSRKSQEAIILDNNIEVKIAKIEGDFVKLAIKAPKSISIVRKEVFDNIKQTNQQASTAAKTSKVPSELVRNFQKK